MSRRAAIVAALLAACSSGDEPGPRLLALSPSQGEDSAKVLVKIAGDNLKPRALTDFSDSSKSELQIRFQAFLVPTDSGKQEVALEGVALEDAQTLSAVVPAGIARGFYGLRVVDPFGRTAALPEVYRAVRSAGELSGFRVAPLAAQRAGVPFWLQVTAIDATGDTVDGFSGTVSVANRTGSLAPTSLGPFALGHARMQVAIGSIAPADAVEVSDGGGHTGSSNDFAVGPGLAVQVAFVSAPQSLDAGACSARLELELRDAQDRWVVADEDVAVALAAAPPDRVVVFADDACSQAVSSVRLTAGAARAAFYLKAQVAGALMVRAQPQGLPSATQLQTVRPLSPSHLEFATPSPELELGACSDALAVQGADAFGNPSPPAAAVPVELLAVPSGALSFFADPLCATPLSGGELGPENLVRLFVRVDVPGSSAIRAIAPGGAALSPGLLVLTVSP